MTVLWTTRDMVDAMGGRPYGPLPESVQGISIDTRTLERGEAFFAIKGENFDGHDFGTAAIAAGAGLMVVAEAKLPALGRLNMPMIVVDDVLKGLERLAAAARSRTHAQVIAVTGSVGKTSTKAALRHVLSAVGNVHASDRSFNNHWGVPLSLARLPANAQYAVFEIGMNHPGEIRPLVKLVRPQIAIITLIAAAHLGFFKDLDEIAKAKAEIFEGIVPGGYALLNRDDDKFKLLDRLAREAGVEHVLGFGEHVRAQFKLIGCDLQSDHSVIAARISGRDITARITMPGRHVVQNMLAVLGAAHLAGAELDTVAAALNSLKAEDGRGRRYQLRHPKGPVTLIDESYNANPTSMAAAIGLLDTAPVANGGRRIAVLGDMFELGSHSERLHAGLSETLGRSKTDLVFLAGPEMKALAARLPDSANMKYCPNVDELKPLLVAAVHPGDAIMIKSSNGAGFGKLVDALKKKYPPAADGDKTA